MKLLKTILAAGCAAACLLAGTAPVQAQPNLRGVQTRPPNPGALAAQQNAQGLSARLRAQRVDRQLTRQDLQTFYPGLIILQPQPTIPWATLGSLIGGDMTGWTALTNGATQGGPAVFRAGDQGWIMVRAGDGKLYVTNLDTVNPGGPIDSAAWRATTISPQSEPHCRGVQGGSATAACTWLGSGGAAWIGFFTLNGQPSVATIDLGGSNAGGRPTLEAEPTRMYVSGIPDAVPSGILSDYRLLVWDGGSGMFRRRRMTLDVTNYAGFWGGAPALPAGHQYGTNEINAAGAPDPAPNAWARLDGEYRAAMGCDGWCVVAGAGDAVRLVSLPYSSTLSQAPQDVAVTPPVPGGLSAGVAPQVVRLGSGAHAIIARNRVGRIYQIVRTISSFGAWRDEGGFVRNGSNFLCLANNEQPICFIQGNDGRIWWRKLATASGL